MKDWLIPILIALCCLIVIDVLELAAELYGIGFPAKQVGFVMGSIYLSLVYAAHELDSRD